MYRGNPRGGSGDTEDRCRGLLRGLPLAVSWRVCGPARDTLRPERSREAVTEVISRECDCTKLPVPRGAAAAAYARSLRGKRRHCTTRLTRACACSMNTCNSRLEVWSDRMEVGNTEWKWKSRMEF